jgi:hypothetical protein
MADARQGREGGYLVTLYATRVSSSACLGDQNCIRQRVHVNVGFVPARLACRDDREDAVPLRSSAALLSRAAARSFPVRVSALATLGAGMFKIVYLVLAILCRPVRQQIAWTRATGGRQGRR